MIIFIDIYCLHIHIMNFDIFKQLLFAVMILFFHSGYTKTIHPSYMSGNWQSIDSLPWVADLISWQFSQPPLELQATLQNWRVVMRMMPRTWSPHGPKKWITNNHKKYWQKSQKWQCKDLLVNSNQGETWWNRLLWFGGADSNYFGSLWGRLMKCFFDELTVETKKEPEAPTGSQVVCVFFFACICLSKWLMPAGWEGVANPASWLHSKCVASGESTASAQKATRWRVKNCSPEKTWMF